MEKYFNDAIIGNKNTVASFSKKGELLRLTYPTPGYKQFINFFHTGVTINDSNIIYIHDDINNIYRQYYTPNTNILNTQIKNTYFNLSIMQTDYIAIKENIMVKKYTFTNENNIDLDINFLIHSSMLTNQNSFIGAKVIENGMIQYSHDYAISTFSKDKKISSHMINDTNSAIFSGKIYDKDYIGMSNDSSISYNIGILKPKESYTLEILLHICHKEEKEKQEEIDLEIERIKKLDLKKQYQSTKSYWERYVKNHKVIKTKDIKNEYYKKIDEIYTRTILLYPLLLNEQTGGIEAAMEIDEERTKCGRYSYCWTRDAVFITKAMDLLNMEKETEKFYKNFCKITQSKNGMWEQRFYTDGKLAPCWGYQIDETASVIYGVYEHYMQKQDKKFLKDTLKMVEKACKFLQKYIEDILEKTNKMHVSYDIWEMNEGIHLYSIASIFGAFENMLKIYETVQDDFKENRLKQEQIRKEKEIIEKMLISIKEYVLVQFYDTKRNTFVRNQTDKNIDISMLGIVVPFKMFSSKEKKVTNTVETINMTLRTYTGGYKRFEYDHYMDGNPWVIATLWMALYNIEIGKIKEAKQCFDYVIETSAKHGFLAEQINNETKKPAWVIGLGWSHAMFIIVLEKLTKIGEI